MNATTTYTNNLTVPAPGLGREYGAVAQRVSRVIGYLPGVSKPRISGPALASVVLDERWAHLRDGAFVLIDKEQQVQPFANDPDCEARLWDATAELLRPD